MTSLNACKRALIIYTTTTLFGATLTTANATETTAITEEDFFSEAPLISTASHFAQKRQDVPGSVSLITQDMIRASGAIELVDVMKLIPGMQSYYINGSRFGMGYHELGNTYPNRMEIKIDGHSIYDVFTNGAEWQSLGIELEDIDYIEVIRTSNAAADGANAFQGTLNIVTKSPVGSDAKHIRLTTGDQHTRNASVVSNDAFGNLDSRLTLRYRHNDGFNALPNDIGDDNNESTQIGWRGITAIDLHNTLEIQLQFSYSNLGLRDSNDAEFIPRNYQYNYQFIRWEHIASPSYKHELMFYRNEISFKEKNELQKFSQFIIDDVDIQEAHVPYVLSALGINDGILDTRNNGKGQRTNVEWKHTHFLPHQLTISWGLGTRLDQMQDRYILATDQWVDEEAHRAFINSQFALSTGTVFNLGYVLEHNTTIGSHYSGRLGVNQHLNDHHTIRLIASESTRAPSNSEFNRQGDIVVDNTLLWREHIADKHMKPETLNSYEVGYLSKFFNQALQIDIKLFREYYRNVIDVREASQPSQAAIHNLVDMLDPSDIPTVQVIGNSSELNNEGVELEIDYRPNKTWLFRAHYAWQNLEGYRLRAEDETPDINTRRTMNAELPSQSGGILLMWSPAERWETSLHYHYKSEVDYFNGKHIDDQDRLDARIAHSLPFGKNTVTLSLIGQNIVKRNPHYEYFDTNEFDTRYYLTANITF